MSTEAQNFINVNDVFANVTRPLEGKNVTELTTAITGRLEDGSTFTYIDRVVSGKDEVDTLMSGATGFYTAINDAVADIITNVDKYNTDN